MADCRPRGEFARNLSTYVIPTEGRKFACASKLQIPRVALE